MPHDSSQRFPTPHTTQHACSSKALSVHRDRRPAEAGGTNRVSTASLTLASPSSLLALGLLGRTPVALELSTLAGELNFDLASHVGQVFENAPDAAVSSVSLRSDGRVQTTADQLVAHSAVNRTEQCEQVVVVGLLGDRVAREAAGSVRHEQADFHQAENRATHRVAGRVCAGMASSPSVCLRQSITPGPSIRVLLHDRSSKRVAGTSGNPTDLPALAGSCSLGAPGSCCKQSKTSLK